MTTVMHDAAPATPEPQRSRAGRAWNALRRHLRMPSRNAALLAAFAFAAAGLHVALVAGWANPLPYSDEWIAIIDNVLRPAANGTLSLFDFLRPHNEHTIVWTRLLAYVAILLDHGQFDNVPVALVNALLYAGAMALPVYLFFRHAAGPVRLFAAVFAVTALVPTEGSDLIFGFQNQYYFLIAGSLLTLWLAATRAPASARSAGGFAAAALATTLAMGSGFFAAIAAMCVMALRWRQEPQQRRALVRLLVAAGVATLLGIVLVLHAFAVMKQAGILGEKHIGVDGLRRVLSCLAWPYGGSALLGAALSLPFAAFAARLALRRERALPLDLLAFGIGLWAGAQICALAFDRNTEATTLASRYLPVMLFWPGMNLYALFRLVAGATPDRAPATARALLSLVAALAAGALVSNVVKLAPASLAEMAVYSQQHVVQADRIARYVRLGDRDALYGAGHMQLPYGSPAKLQQLLDDPGVRNGLPANTRAALALRPDAAVATTFVPFGAYSSAGEREGLRGYGSYAPTGDATTGRFASQPLRTTFPYLRIDLAGYQPEPGLTVALECVDAPCPAVPVQPRDEPRESWRGLYVPVPAASIRLVADDSSRSRWLAFTAPLEVGRLSVLADAFVNALRANAQVAFALACGILALLLLLGLWREPGAGER